METLKQTAQLRLCEMDGSYKSDPVIQSDYGTPFAIQQAWVDMETGQVFWKNLPVVWMGDPEWVDGS